MLSLLFIASLTNYIPREDPGTQENTEKEDEANLSKIQTNTSMKRTQSRRESRPRESDESDSFELFRRRKRYSNYAKEETIHDKKTKGPNKSRLEKIDDVWRKAVVRIYLKLLYLDKYPFKCAFKMAVAVLVLCVPAFVPASNDWYTNIRGQWAPLTVIAIMNPTR